MSVKRGKEDQEKEGIERGQEEVYKHVGEVQVRWMERGEERRGGRMGGGRVTYVCSL